MQLVDEGLLELDTPVARAPARVPRRRSRRDADGHDPAPAHAHERHRRRRLHRHRPRRRLPRAVRRRARRGRAEPPARRDVVVLQLGLLAPGAARRARDRHDLGSGAPGAADRAARAPRHRDARGGGDPPPNRRRSCRGAGGRARADDDVGPAALGRACGAHLGAGCRRARLRADASLRRSRGRRQACALAGERRGDDREAGRAPRPAHARRLVGSRLDPVRLGRRAARRSRRHDARSGGVSPRPSLAGPRRLAPHERRPRPDLSRELLREVFAELAGVQMPAPVEPAPRPSTSSPRAYVGRYERAGLTTEVFEGDEGLVLRSTVTGAFAALVPEPVHEYALAPVEPDVFAIRAPGTTSWIARHVLRARRRRALRPLRGARESARGDVESRCLAEVRHRARSLMAKSQCGGAADAFRDVPTPQAGIKPRDSASAESRCRTRNCAGARSPSGAHAMHGRRREAPPGSVGRLA